MKLVGAIALLLFLSSCHRSLRQPSSVLQAYEQFRVLSQVKSRIRGGRLSAEERRELFELAEELAPRDPEVKLLRASDLKNAGQLEEARTVLENAIQLAPTYGPALSAYGEILISGGWTEEGKNYCLYALKLNPIDSKARDCVGKTSFKFNR